MSTKILKKADVFQIPDTEAYLQAALETTTWIQNHEIVTEYGKVWQQSPETDIDYDTTPYFTKKSLYSGSSGIGFYFIRLYEVTKERKWLDEACAAANHIIGTGKEYQDFYTVKESDTAGIVKIGAWTKGLYTGPAGEGLFLAQLYQVTGKQEYLDYAVKTADQLLDVAIETEQGIYWTQISDLSADSGFILFLLYLYQITKETKYLNAAKKGADFITTEACAAPEGGKYWKVIDVSKMGFGLPEGKILPNFMHGTSGIAYMYAVLYQNTGEEAYLEYAKEGLRYIESIAVGDEQAKLLPYMDEPGVGADTDIFYLGMCHGPAGSAITFELLYQITGDNHYLEWVKKLSRGIIKAGAPARKSKGYWNNDCYCCGAPGLIEHFVEVYQLCGEEEFLHYAEETAAILLGDSFAAENGRRWYSAWTRVKPQDVESYTGLYVGSAGCAAALLRLYAVKHQMKISDYFEFLFLKRKTEK